MTIGRAGSPSPVATPERDSRTENGPVRDLGNGDIQDFGYPFDPSTENPSRRTTVTKVCVPYTELSAATISTGRITRFWNTVRGLVIKEALPKTKFLAFDFDLSIANMEPEHHIGFRAGAVGLMKEVDSSFSEKDSKFGKFWEKARKGFGLQERETLRAFIGAISEVYPDAYRKLLVRAAGPDDAAAVTSTLDAGGNLSKEYLGRLIECMGADLKSRKDAVVQQRIDDGTINIRLIPGAIDLIKRAKAEGFLVGLATGSPSTFVRPLLQKLGILDLFDATIYNDDEAITSDRQRKPGGFPYEELTRRLSKKAGYQLTTAEGLAFEDSLTGLRAAHAAGMPVILRPPTLSWIFRKVIGACSSGIDESSSAKMAEKQKVADDRRDKFYAEINKVSFDTAPVFIMVHDTAAPESRQNGNRPNHQRLTWDDVVISRT